MSKELLPNGHGVYTHRMKTSIRGLSPSDIVAAAAREFAAVILELKKNKNPALREYHASIDFYHHGRLEPVLRLYRAAIYK